MKKGTINIAFAFGGKAAEHDLSIKSALYLLAHLDREKYNASCLYIDTEGKIVGREAARTRILKVLNNRKEPVFGKQDAVPHDLGNWIQEILPPEDPFETIALLHSGKVDVVFPVFHGQGGEDGLFQGFLEIMGVPYVGCRVTGSVIGNDKAYNKVICRNAGILVADFISFSRCRWEKEPGLIFDEAERCLGLPLFIKPPSLGSSIGISKAADRRTFSDGVWTALAYGDRVLVERALAGKEYGVGVIGNGTLLQSAIVEFGGSGAFLDYESKYGPHAYEDRIPAPLPVHTAMAMRESANRIYRLLGLRGMARIDFFLVGKDLYFNEANTVPGFGRTSVFSRMWTAVGIDLKDLIDTLAIFALEGNHPVREHEKSCGE